MGLRKFFPARFGEFRQAAHPEEQTMFAFQDRVIAAFQSHHAMQYEGEFRAEAVNLLETAMLQRF